MILAMPVPWYKIEKKDGCWEWKGKKRPDGYGVCTKMVGGKTQYFRVHRLTYMEAKGEIPKGLVLDHLCRNPSCVNPDHLEAVTHTENKRRGMGVAALNERKIFCKRGHKLDGDNLLRLPRSGGRFHRNCRTCVRKAVNERRLLYGRSDTKSGRQKRSLMQSKNTVSLMFAP